MATNYALHSRMVYANYEDIQKAVDAKIINANDIVICKDTREMIIIREDGSLFPVNARHYRFDSQNSALEYLNKSADTYEGQFVSIKNKFSGNYDGFIVNKENGKYIVKNVSVADSVEFDYNKALNKPIDIVTGSVFEPILITDLKDGFYKVVGAYKMSGNAVTVYSSSTGHFVIVETIDGVKYIKQITAQKIIDYKVDVTGTVSSEEMPTKQWVKEQNFATVRYVDDKVSAMDFLTKSEAAEYISKYIDASIDKIVADTVDRVVDERFTASTENEINNLFGG